MLQKVLVSISIFFLFSLKGKTTIGIWTIMCFWR